MDTAIENEFHLAGGAQYNIPIPQREQDVKLVKEMLDKHNLIQIVGEEGSGKRSLMKYYVSAYSSEYEFILNLDDLLYSVYYFNFMFANCEGYKSLKQFFGETKRTFLIMVSNMQQYKHEEFLDKLKMFLPIDQPLGKNQHIVLKGYTPFQDIPVFNLPPITLESTVSLGKAIVTKYELSEVDFSSIYDLTKGNIHFSIVLFKYINKFKQDNLEGFLDTLRTGAFANPRKELFQIIMKAEFQMVSVDLFQLFYTFVWFHSYITNKDWFEHINRVVLKKPEPLVGKFLEIMEYYDFYRDVQDSEYIPCNSSQFTFRELIPDRSECLNDFIYSLVMLLKHNLLPKLHTMLLYRHIFYYLERGEFSSDYEKASILIVSAEALYEHFGKTREGLELALRALEIKVEKNDPILARIHKNLGFMYGSNELENYSSSVTHLKESIKIFTINESKYPFKTKAFLMNHLGYSYTKLKKFKEAISTHESAMEYVEGEKSIDYTETYYFLGYAYFEMGDYNKAIHHFRQSIRTGILYNFNLLDQYLHLAKSYYAIGDVKKANESMRSIIDFKNASKEVKAKYQIQYSDYTKLVDSKKPSSFLIRTTIISTVILTASLLFLKFYKK